MIRKLSMRPLSARQSDVERLGRICSFGLSFGRKVPLTLQRGSRNLALNPTSPPPLLMMMMEHGTLLARGKQRRDDHFWRVKISANISRPSSPLCSPLPFLPKWPVPSLQNVTLTIPDRRDAAAALPLPDADALPASSIHAS